MLSKQKYYQAIRDYYRESNWLYKYVWYSGKSLGLHFGFADDKTANHTEALINQYRYVIDKAKIKKGTRLLDAGCGVGGAAIYMARETGAEVLGITLVPEQATEAKLYAKRAGVNNLVDFRVGDYLKTGLGAGSFDVVFGLESVCYAMPKLSFVKEAYRVLKPGGVLVITDGYRKREVSGQGEKMIMKEFCEEWRLGDLVSYREMTQVIKEGGFGRLTIKDETEAINMSLNKMRRLVSWWKVGEVILGWVNLPVIEMARANAKAMDAWIRGIESGLFGYFAHVAIKPKR